MRLPYLLIGLFVWGAGGFLTYLRVPPQAILVIFVVGLLFIILGLIAMFIQKRTPRLKRSGVKEPGRSKKKQG